jgi:hypothetical protein
MKNLVIAMLMMAGLCLAVFPQAVQDVPGSVAVTQTQTVANDNSKVTVFVYRYKQWVGSALEPAIYCDEVEIAKMDNGAYFKVMLDPGKHTFQSNDKQSGVVLDLKSGEDYYIRMELVEGVWKGKGRLVLVPKEQGAFEIQKLKPLDKKKIKDTSKAFTDDKAPAKTT